MKSKIFFSVIFILAFVIHSFAQLRELTFKNFTQEEGLPSNESYFVYRDSKNFLWIATDQGVVRYNGSKMERFNLPDNVVFKIREDNKGRIWFFSYTGKLAYFFNGIIYPYQYNYLISAKIKNILIIDAYVNENDDIFIASTYKNYKISKSGIMEVNENGLRQNKDAFTFNIRQVEQHYYFSEQISYGWSDTVFISVTRQNRIIRYCVPCKIERTPQYGCVTIGGKELFFFADNKILKLNSDGSFKIKELPSQILCLHADKDNNIWAGLLRNGAVLLNADLTEIENTQILKDKSISSVTNDYEGGTWFSTLEKGVYYLKNIHLYNLVGDTSFTQPVFRFCNMHDSTLLFANAQGLYQFSNNSFSAVFINKSETIKDLFVDGNAIYLAGNFNLAGKLTVNNPFYSFNKIRQTGNILSNKIVLIRATSEIIKLAKSKYLLGLGAGLELIDFNKVNINKIDSNYLTTTPISIGFKPSFIFSDLKNKIWLGSVNMLYKLNSKLDNPVPFKESSVLFQKGITCMRQMENNIYTIGIRFGGIALMQDSSIIGSITEADGLLSNSVRYLLPLKDQLWAATAKGISVIKFQSYNPLKYTIINIGRNEGFYNILINQLIQFQGNILAATSNGIYVIENPVKFLERSPQPVPFFINTINYYKGDTSGINTISVPYKNNRLKIKYSAICFDSPEEVKYYYRFGTNDTAWQTITGTELLLENLSPGIYDLELKAGIPNQNRASDIQELKITIEKPWWQNNWLRLAAMILFAGIIYFFYKNRINKIKNRERQKAIQQTRMIELEQTALRSQMNPHFIFNCLTSIQQLIVNGKTIDANEHLVRFARLIRKTLELSARSYIKIAEEKDYLAEYLFLEQLRMPDQFDFSIEIDTGIDINKTEIPNMMLQPIIENCIRHGIKQLENKKGSITLSIQQKAGFIFCMISDNGVGRNDPGKFSESSFPEQKSYGMDIVRKRLELLAETRQEDFLIEIKDLQNADGSAAGTEVIIQLPYKTSSI